MAGIALSGKRYSTYPEYKDSGVDWIGKIPKNWSLKKLKYLAPIVGEKAENKTNPIALENIESWTSKLIETKTEFEGVGVRFIAGDILFGKLRPYLAKVYRTDMAGEAIGDFHVMRPISDSYGRFLTNLMLTKDYISTVDASTYGAKMPRASWEFTSNIELPFCSSIEAVQIANFLDHETAKINTLIAKQEKLIALLKEKRQAVISHAVTRGLSNKEQPNVPMKDSGVEWLGEVPKHWQMKPLKCLCSFSGGGTPSKDKLEYWNGDIPWVSPKDMKSFWIENSIDKVTNLGVEQSSTKIVKTGSLLMVVRSGILQHSIPIGITKKEVTLNQDMKALDFNKLMSAIYFSYFVRSNQTNLLLVWGKDGATVESIEQEYLASFSIPVPPMSEQHDICNNLDKIMARLDKLTEKSLIQIELLKERKTALISAAVTGKIDVRHFALKEEVNHG